MGRIYVFADEAGNFNFDRSPGASRYFILTTVTLADCSVGHDLLELRRQLTWEGVELTDHFHATEETQAVRDVVLQVARATHIQTAFWPAAIDPCLQVADYCCWAIQRKWERGDNRSHVLIAEKIASELDIFRFGSVTHY